MSKILELADAYVEMALDTDLRRNRRLARAELAAEVEKLEAAFNDRVRVIEMQLQDKEALQAEVDEQREDYLAKCSELEAVHEHYRIITVKLQAELEAARKDAARYRWLRVNSCWTKGGLVVTSVKNVQLGAMCPTDTTLDQTIDAAMEATK